MGDEAPDDALHPLQSLSPQSTDRDSLFAASQHRTSLIMSRQERLLQRSRAAGLKCALSIIVLIGCCIFAVVACLWSSILGFTACWVVGIVALLSAMNFGRKASELSDDYLRSQLPEPEIKL